MSGEALADKMLGFVTDHLDPFKMRGQAASNMSGRRNGAAARILSVYTLAMYTHCASHSLNLVYYIVVASFEEPSVRNMIGVVHRVSTFFFTHPKRQKKLEEAIQNTQSVVKLKRSM